MKKVLNGLALTAILAISLLATTGSAEAKTLKSQPLIIGSSGVTWEGGFVPLGVTWE